MKQKIKRIYKKIDNIFSWFFLIAMIALAVYTISSVTQAKKTGDQVFVFGHRPVFILTGSMEPYMMTNSIAITKEVTDISQLEVGDVVSYHVNTEDGKTLRITHRIIGMENDLIYTKGDNNKVEDGFALTIDNIEAEVTVVFNQVATLIAKWQSSTTGKVFIISAVLAIFLFITFIKMMIKSFFEDEEDESADNKIIDTISTDVDPEESSDKEALKNILNNTD